MLDRIPRPGRQRGPSRWANGAQAWCSGYAEALRDARPWAYRPAGGGVRLHDLRHTYASLSASAGIPAYRLADYMGHASEIVTRTIYTHLFATDAAADMDLLERPAVPARQDVKRLG